MRVTSLFAALLLAGCGGDSTPMSTTPIDHVACGNADCSVSSGGCCLAATLSCEGPSACSGTLVQCDGPEDCSGSLCCLSGGKFACAATCDAAKSEIRICHSLKDCGTDSNVCLAKTIGASSQSSIVLGECASYTCMQPGCDLSHCPSDSPCVP
jgi:hypothetical protein